jgi:hypothetical protein
MDEINTQGGTTCANTIAVLRCAIQAVDWDTTNQAFVFNTVNSESGKFNVSPGKGFFVNLSKVPPSGGWNVTGVPISAPVPLSFQSSAGFHLVGVPYTAVSGGYDSRQIMDAINTQGGTTCANTIAVLRCAIQAVEWDATNQAFVFNTVNSESGKFAIDRTKGFFVNISTQPPGPFSP